METTEENSPEWAEFMLNLAWRKYDNFVEGEAKLESKLNMLLVANGLLISIISIWLQSQNEVILFIFLVLPFISIIWLTMIISRNQGVIYPNLDNLLFNEKYDKIITKLSLAHQVNNFCNELKPSVDNKLINYIYLIYLFVGSVGAISGMIIVLNLELIF